MPLPSTGTTSIAVAAAILGFMTVAPLPAEAEDIINVRRMTMELAAEIANGAVMACRGEGYQVSAVVVDRTGNMQAAMRDTLASRFTLQIAEEKANAVVLSGVNSSVFRQSRADIRDEMNEVDGIMLLDGGVEIRAAGSLLGAVGVSGAPGGDIDERCALKGLAGPQERLDFVD